MICPEKEQPHTVCVGIVFKIGNGYETDMKLAMLARATECTRG